jgi:hypothetical protein
MFSCFIFSPRTCTTLTPAHFPILDQQHSPGAPTESAASHPGFIFLKPKSRHYLPATGRVTTLPSCTARSRAPPPPFPFMKLCPNPSSPCNDRHLEGALAAGQLLDCVPPHRSTPIKGCHTPAASHRTLSRLHFYHLLTHASSSMESASCRFSSLPPTQVCHPATTSCHR